MRWMGRAKYIKGDGTSKNTVCPKSHCWVSKYYTIYYTVYGTYSSLTDGLPERCLSGRLPVTFSCLFQRQMIYLSHRFKFCKPQNTLHFPLNSRHLVWITLRVSVTFDTLRAPQLALPPSYPNTIHRFMCLSCFISTIYSFELGHTRHCAGGKSVSSHLKIHSNIGELGWLGIATRLPAGRPRDFGSIPDSDSIVFSIKSKPALGPTRPPIQWIQGAVSREVKLQGREAERSPPINAEIKKMWIYTSTSPYFFTAKLSTGTTLPSLTPEADSLDSCFPAVSHKFRSIQPAIETPVSCV
jgi:hypothetical protein